MRDLNALSPFILNSQLSRGWQFLLANLLVCLVSAICVPFSAWMGSQVVAFILLLTLSLIALFFTILPVLSAALLSALIWDFFFLLPRYHFQLKNTEDRILLAMYFVIASVNAVLTYKIRQIEKHSRAKEEKAKALALYNTLFNSLSHELRTPIATIVGATDNLLTEPSRLSQKDSRILLSEIAIASQRLSRQVDNLLNMSRLESGFIRIKKDWCNIRELICSIVQVLEEPLATHQVSVDISERLPLVRLDYGLMEQVLHNLIYNAAQYTPAQSSVYVRAGCRDGCLEIIVEDDGAGFPEEEIRRVFEKFYRPAGSAPGGAGLGLSIVRGFVEAHNGTILLTNRPDGGARFVINIPVEKLYLSERSIQKEAERAPLPT